MQWYTVRDAARLLDVSEDMVRDMLNRGEMRFKKFGRLIRIPESELKLPTEILALRKAI